MQGSPHFGQDNVFLSFGGSLSPPPPPPSVPPLVVVDEEDDDPEEDVPGVLLLLLLLLDLSQMKDTWKERRCVVTSVVVLHDGFVVDKIGVGLLLAAKERYPPEMVKVYTY